MKVVVHPQIVVSCLFLNFFSHHHFMDERIVVVFGGGREGGREEGIGRDEVHHWAQVEKIDSYINIGCDSGSPVSKRCACMKGVEETWRCM